MVSAVGLDLLGMHLASSLMLLDSQRSSFESPEICEQVIRTFNNMTVGEGKHATELQIRYADTEKQKQLKTCTAERRQFKTNEYNEAVYGPGSPYGFYSPLSATFQSPVPVRAPGQVGQVGHGATSHQLPQSRQRKFSAFSISSSIDANNYKLCRIS